VAGRAHVMLDQRQMISGWILCWVAAALAGTLLDKSSFFMPLALSYVLLIVIIRRCCPQVICSA